MQSLKVGEKIISAAQSERSVFLQYQPGFFGFP
jgi:hypothetical protein